MKNSLDSENNIIITEFPHTCKVIPKQTENRSGVDFNKIVHIYNRTSYIYGRWNVHIYKKILIAYKIPYKTVLNCKKNIFLIIIRKGKNIFLFI